MRNTAKEDCSVAALGGFGKRVQGGVVQASVPEFKGTAGAESTDVERQKASAHTSRHAYV